MTAESNVVARPKAPPEQVGSTAERSKAAGIRPGWITIAAKEFADHLLSVRLYVLLIVLGIAALIPLYFAADRLRALGSQVSGESAVFLALFTLSPENVSILRVDLFVAIAAPLLGVGFAFDAVNGERHEGTLPRLLSQPIHRDDVINGKFAAGLAIITVALIAALLLIAGFGLLRLGIAPSGSEVIRLVAWLGLTILYVALWLAFGTLLSVVIRRAATSALVGLGVWFFIAVPQFGQLVVSLLGAIIAPGGNTAQDQLSALSTQQFLLRLLPSTLYREASVVLLNPRVASGDVSVPATIDQYEQYQQQIGSLLSLDQSILLVWPHVVILFALTVGCFALAYVRFMRQEVRA
jgi:ABC-2 type transport system permease protein